MDVQPSEKKGQALSDDQELAKVLAGVNGDSPDDDSTVTEPDVMIPPLPPTDDSTMPDPLASGDVASPAQPVAAPLNNDLESIKQEALGELRPLVDKLNVSPEEKFDTYLLLLRSTDDRELIAPAHEAAKSIADESRKAQALLDIIKEIDFLNQQPQVQ